jgi:hypothetical protein
MASKGVKEIFEQIITQINDECEIKCTQQFYADTFNEICGRLDD